MDTRTFLIVVAKSQDRDVKVLAKKGLEYTVEGDRLAQFDRAAALKDTNAALEVVNMATKHFTSVASMSEAPNMYPRAMWEEKITDLRNYMHLLEGVLIDMGVE
jgi:hypothetical protein